VLDANVEVLAAGVEDPAGPLRFEVVEGRDADAAVTQQVLVAPVGEAGPQVVVVGTEQVGDGLAVLVDDPVLGAVEAGQPQRLRLGAQVRIGGLWDWGPAAQSVLGALSVVGGRSPDTEPAASGESSRSVMGPAPGSRRSAGMNLK
jgi:hypothetical protein